MGGIWGREIGKFVEKLDDAVQLPMGHFAPFNS